MNRYRLQSGRVRFAALAILCALASASPASAADRALIVGIGEFADSSMNLQGIDLDVAMVQEVADLLGFQEIRTLSDADATYGGFVREFEQWLINGTGAGDRVLVYVSSHGTRVPDDNGDESDRQDEVLVMHDTRRGSGKLETFLRDDEFSVLLRRLRSRDVLVLIDACNSGTVYKAIRLRNASLGEREAQTKFLDYPGMPVDSANAADAVAVDDKNVGVRQRERADNFAFLAAAADDELALATPKGSVFTLGLKAIVKEAAAKRRTLTLQNLKDEVEAYIRNKIATEMSGHRVHTPQLGGNPELVKKALRLVVPSQGGRTWRRLEALAGHGTAMAVKAGQKSYRVEDEVVFTIDIPHTGYLNVVNVGPQDNATVLFPNKFHRNNRVQRGLLTLPTDQMPFYFPAMKPVGDTLTVAILTERTVNLYESAVEGRDKNGEFTAILAPLSAKATRDVGVASRQNQRFAAGKVIFKVTD